MSPDPFRGCPNDPPCPHGALLHDIWTADDPRPMCCVDGCDCGKAALSWRSQLDPLRVAQCYGLDHAIDYGPGRGSGLLITTGAGLLLSDMDVLPNCRWAIDIGANRGHPNAASWAAVCGQLVSHTIAHLWMAITDPAWMDDVLAQLPPFALAVCSRPPILRGYQATGISELETWSAQWTS